jgi:hypothetical protein
VEFLVVISVGVWEGVTGEAVGGDTMYYSSTSFARSQDRVGGSALDRFFGALVRLLDLECDGYYARAACDKWWRSTL